MKCGNRRRPAASGTNRNSPANAALAIPPTAVKKTIQARRAKGFALLVEWSGLGYHGRQPDQRRHPSALPIAPERKEPCSIPVRTPPAAKHVPDTERCESLPSDRVKIALPTTARVGNERGRGPGIAGHKRRPHIIPNLEMLLTDRGAQPGEQIRRRYT